MPYTHEWRPQLVIKTFEGHVSAEEFVRSAREVAADARFDALHCIVADFTGCTGHSVDESALEELAVIRFGTMANNPRVRVAVVAGSEPFERLAGATQHPPLAGSHTTAIFPALAAALTWAAERPVVHDVERFQPRWAPELPRSPDAAAAAADVAPARAQFDALAEGVVWQDATGMIVDANAAAAPILGLTRDELLGRTPRDPRWYAVREDGSPWPGSEHPGMVALRTALPQRGCVMGIILPSGGRRWISISSMPQTRPGSSAATGVVTSFFDISAQVEDRHRQQRRAQELERQYDDAPCSDYLLDLTGRYRQINETGLRWLGIERAALLGQRGPEDFMPEASRQTFVEHFHRVVTGESVGGLVVEMIGANRVHRWVQVSAHPVRNPQGQVIAARVVQQDASAGRRGRDAADRLAAQQHLMLDNDLVGIARIRDRRIVWKNRAFGRILGYGQGELVGQQTAVLFPDEAAFAAFGEASARALAQAGSYRATIELRRKDGAVVWADCSGAMLDEATGESMWFSKDVTAQRQAHALQLKAAELEAESRQLRETVRLQSVFLANVSHELRTPLNAVIGFASLLRRGGPSDDPAKRGRFLEQIEAGGRQLLTMVENLLDLARLEGGRLELRPERFDLRGLMAEVANLLADKARAREIRIVQEVDEAVAQPCLDRLRLAQVLFNYLGNAIKFSRQGGTVTMRAQRATADRLRVEVADEGIGIAEADQQRLFVRFRQLDSGSTKVYEGTGIGLALVKQVAEAQGGSVGLRSILGTGSVFWIELPLASSAGGAGAPPRA